MRQSLTNLCLSAHGGLINRAIGYKEEAMWCRRRENLRTRRWVLTEVIRIPSALAVLLVSLVLASLGGNSLSGRESGKQAPTRPGGRSDDGGRRSGGRGGSPYPLHF